MEGRERDQNYGICDNGSTSSAEASQVKVTIRRAFQAADEEGATGKPQTV